MKLEYVEISGFRAFRERTRIDIPPGFAIVTGQNGSGKSTICDAIEFALTGAIRSSSEHSEKGETIGDYLWWRGERDAAQCYVELGLRNTDGITIAVRRSPDGQSIRPAANLMQALIADGVRIDDAMAQLCRTTILRDEEITRLSIDLRETDRFEFVRAALGTADFSASIEKAKKVSDILKAQLAEANKEYELQRDRITQLVARLAEARASAGRAAGLEEADAVIRRVVQVNSGELRSLMPLAEQKLATLRTRSEMLTRLARRAEDLSRRLAQIVTPEYDTRVREQEAKLAGLDGGVSEVEASVAQARQLLERAQQESPRLASLAQVHEHGRRVGLQGGACPLCGLSQDVERFQRRLEELKFSIDLENVRVAELTRQVADLYEKAARERATRDKARQELDRLRNAESLITQELEEIGVELSASAAPEGPSELLAVIAAESETNARQTVELESAIAAVRASLAAGQAAEIERELASVRTSLESAEKRLSKVKRGQGSIVDGIQAMRRLQGEVVDEQLAGLSPLLVEIYQRLRPHVDWQTLRYRLRGDVRRMLSLEVGPGLNPNYVFSSGQRRAAGLAFLLAIHLSRGWSRLETLVLDDPVQHVDDYRALHLTEVLAAIRRSKRQVLCTVEDRALARLLARRLRSDVDEEGILVELAHEPTQGARIVGHRVIQPFRKNVLVAAV